MLTFLLSFMMLITSPDNIYTFKVNDINGKSLDLSQFKGKKILVVNTASKCGYTPQYEDLEKLYQAYKGKLVIIGFPANNFGGQEPGTNPEIQQFCSSKFNVTFPMASKVSVKGSDIDALFKWLTTQDNPDFKGDIHWNFEKFLINENGILVHRYRSGTKPMDESITKDLK